MVRDNKLKDRLNLISFILRLDRREDTLYLNIIYSKFKIRYKVLKNIII